MRMTFKLLCHDWITSGYAAEQRPTLSLASTTAYQESPDEDRMLSGIYAMIQQLAPNFEANPSSGSLTQSRYLHIARLSADMLLNVFFILRDLDEKHKGWNWMTVTHVCRLWRHIALDCPLLWARIESYSPAIWHLDKIRAFLKRSAQSEIKAGLFIPDSLAISISSAFKDHMWRICELKIIGYSSGLNVMESHFPLLSHRAKVLELRSASDETYTITNDAENYPNIQLESLSVSSVFLPWTTSLFRGLVSLTVKHHFGVAGPVFTLFQFVKILKYCPDLQHLEIIYSNFDTDSLYSPPLEISYLESPRLKRLLLHGMSFYLCLDFFQMISVDDMEMLDLAFYDYPVQEPVYLHPKMLNVHHEKECKLVNINVREHCFVLRTESAWEGDCPRKRASYDPIIRIYPSPFNGPLATINSITFLLNDPFLKTAREVAIALHRVGKHDVNHYSRPTVWIALLNGLPDCTVQLNIRFSPEYQRPQEATTGLLEAISSLVDEDDPNTRLGARLQELEITIYCAYLSAGDVGERYRALSKHLGERTANGRRTFKVQILDYDNFKPSSNSLDELTSSGYGMDD